MGIDHKLTKKVERELNKLADRMPKMFEKDITEKIYLSGKIIKQTNPHAVNEFDKPLEDHKMYLATIKKEINKRKWLKGLFKTGGYKAVDKAIGEFLENIKVPGTDVAEAIS